MRIHTKILRKRLKKTRSKALKLIDGLRESWSPQRRDFRNVIDPEILLGVAVEKNRFLISFPSRTLFNIVAERVSIL